MKPALSPRIAQSGKPHSWVSLMFTCVTGLPRPGKPNALKDVFDSPGRPTKGLSTPLTLRDAGTQENSLLQAHTPDLCAVHGGGGASASQHRTSSHGHCQEEKVRSRVCPSSVPATG